MPTTLPLPPDNYYHVYNKGVNGADLFRSASNYTHFLRLYETHVDPVVDTYAWCLLGNHFHLLVRVKEMEEEGGINLSGLVSKKFSNFFNAYAKALNRQQGRRGVFFERPFRRKLVDSENYFRQLVVYIHSNPVKHGFTDDFRDYPRSSYGTILSAKPTRLQRNRVLGWFDGVGNFVDVHRQIIDFDFIEHLIID